jgi:hypothetical protein
MGGELYWDQPYTRQSINHQTMTTHASLRLPPTRYNHTTRLKPSDWWSVLRGRSRAHARSFSPSIRSTCGLPFSCGRGLLNQYSRLADKLCADVPLRQDLKFICRSDFLHVSKVQQTSLPYPQMSSPTKHEHGFHRRPIPRYR